MVVGVLEVDLSLAENHSLKGKRQVLRAVKDRVRNHFNVSIAEVEGHDLWQRSTLGIACVSTDRSHANEILSRVVKFIEEMRLADVTDYRIGLV